MLYSLKLTEQTMEEIHSQLISDISEKLDKMRETCTWMDLSHKTNGKKYAIQWHHFCDYGVYLGPIKITLEKRENDILVTTEEHALLPPFDDGSRRDGTTIRSCTISTVAEGLCVFNHFINDATDC